MRRAWGAVDGAGAAVVGEWTQTSEGRDADRDPRRDVVGGVCGCRRGAYGGARRRGVEQQGCLQDRGAAGDPD